MDWGHFCAGSSYYVENATDVRECGVTETICTVFMGPEPYGACRCVLLCDLQSFFKLDEEKDFEIVLPIVQGPRAKLKDVIAFLDDIDAEYDIRTWGQRYERMRISKKHVVKKEVLKKLKRRTDL